MRNWLALLLVALAIHASLDAQTPAEQPADPTFYAVAYVETSAASSAIAAAALRQYRDASRKQDGYVRIEPFEQIGRPGHFAVIETWRDQKAFEARDLGARKQMIDALQPIRVSDYDERPYKTLTVGPRSVIINSQAVYVISHVDVAQGPQPPLLLRRLAEESRRERGNVRFDVVQHMMRANHFTVVESWPSQQALDVHVAAPHTKEYRDALQPLTGSPLDERVYKALQ